MLVRIEHDLVEGEDVDDSDLGVLVLGSEGSEVGVEGVSEGDGPGGEEGSERRRCGDVWCEDSKVSGVEEEDVFRALLRLERERVQKRGMRDES